MPRRPSASICRCRKLQRQSTVNGKAVRAKAPAQSCFRSPAWDAARAWSQSSACLDLCGCGKRLAEWPVVIAPGTHDVEKYSCDQNRERVSNLLKKIFTGQQNVSKAEDGKNCGNWVKPHAERARHVGPAYAQNNNSHSLKDELQQNTNDHQRRDYVRKREKAKQQAGAAQRQK